MILHDLPAGTMLFRAHTPERDAQPTSGVGTLQTPLDRIAATHVRNLL